MNTIKKLITEARKVYTADFKEHSEVLEIIQDLNGKPINKRTLSAKRLKRFEFIQRNNMFYISGSREHLIGYQSNPFIDIESFVERFDTPNSKGSTDSLTKLEKIDAKQLQSIQNRLKKSFDTLVDVFQELEDKDLDAFNNPIYYKMLENVHDDSEIRLSSFKYVKKLP